MKFVAAELWDQAAASDATPRQSGAATTLRLGIELRALLLEVASFLLHCSAQRVFFRQLLFSSEFSDVFRYLHAAEVRTAHGTEMRGLGAFLRQGLVVEVTRGLRIEREIELIFPPKFEARFGDRIVAILRAGMAFGEIGGVRGDLV